MTQSPFPLEFLYEDDTIFIVYKPSCIHSVGGAQNEEEAPSLGAELSKKFGDVCSKENEGGLVQRLDFETSGAVLGAKTPEAYLALRDVVQTGALKKSYLALLSGVLDAAQEVEGWIGPRYRGSKKVSLWNYEPRGEVRALFGESRYLPRQVLSSKHGEEQATIVRVEAHLARRHQVRVGAKSLEMPLVGDTLYGGKGCASDFLEFSSESGEAPPFFLHAHEMEFAHPFVHGKIIKIKCDPKIVIPLTL